MDILLLWLIITPLFFAFGWFAGRIDMKTVLQQAKHLPKRIYDSLDALIDNKTGIAKDELRQVIEQEPQLTELQFSLGRLYRKRGENDLAIKLHHKMLNSQFVLSNEIKENIQLELATDFQKAGLIDRAESTLIQLLQSEFYQHQALEMLLLIYQQDKNWAEAIETAIRLANSDISFHTEVAQFNCELTQEAIIKSNYPQAIAYAEMALSTNRKCARANILLGETYYNQEDYAKAILTWQLIEKQNYLYLPLVLSKMFEAYLRLDKIREGLTLFKGYVTLYPNLNIYEFMYNTLITYDTREATIDYLRNTMRQSPNSQVAALLIEARVNTSENHENLRDAEQIKKILLTYNDKLAYYRCGCCNFKSKTFFWQCPVCYSWESINPNYHEI